MSAFKSAIGQPQQPTTDPGKLSSNHILQFSNLPTSALQGLDFSGRGGLDFSQQSPLAQFQKIAGSIPEGALGQYSAPQPAAAPQPQENLPATPLEQMNEKMKDILRRQQSGELGFPGGDVESLYGNFIPNYYAFMGKKAPGSDAGP